MPHVSLPLHPLVNRLLQEQNWTQFQFYIMNDDGPELVLIGRITKISIGEFRRLACDCSEVFGSKGNGRWESILPYTKPFLVPGCLERHVPELSDTGTIGMIASNAEDCSLTMFFREEDAGNDVQHAETHIRKLDLNAVAVVATPVPKAEPDSPDDIPF